MTTSIIIDALGLPPESCVDQRIAKKLLIENGSTNAADKKAINQGIDELTWIAALKSSNCGVPVYKDEEREYIEIAVLLLSLRDVAKVGGQKEARIIELLHRAIPYPVFLIVRQADRILLSLAPKRWAQNEGEKVVLDGEPIVVLYENRPWNNAFLSGINLGKQDRRDFHALYQSWMARVILYYASTISATFLAAEGDKDIEEIRTAIDEYERLGRELGALNASALKENQLNRRVELNMEIKRLESIQKNIKARLQ
jgi:hypothetical protein